MKGFRPKTKLVIRPEIRKKIEAHGASADHAREFFEQFQWQAIPHPVEEGDDPWDPPRWVVEREFHGHLHRMVFVMVNPPGTEAILVTFFPENNAKHDRLGTAQ